MVIQLSQIIVFFLILARLLGLLMRAPFFSYRAFPAAIRVALGVFVSFILWYAVPLPKQLPTTLIEFLLALVLEVLLGTAIGFVSQVIILAIQAAGELMDMQMGLSVARMLDPAFGAEISVVGRFIQLVGLLLFLILNGHLLILSILMRSFQLIPVGGAINFSPGFAQQMINLGAQLWLIAAQLAAPVVLIIFLSDFAFGMVSRVAPQVNVFMLGFQVKPSLGFLMFLLTLPYLTHQIMRLVELTATETTTLLGAMLYVK